MEENSPLFGALLEKLENFSKTSIDLFKLKAIDKLSDILSNVVFYVLIGLLVFVFLLFLNLAIAFWINDLLGKEYAGFFIVSGFYLLLILIVVVFNKRIIRAPLISTLISKLLK